MFGDLKKKKKKKVCGFSLSFSISYHFAFNNVAFTILSLIVFILQAVEEVEKPKEEKDDDLGEDFDDMVWAVLSFCCLLLLTVFVAFFCQ